MITPSDVRWAYKYYLGRNPDDAAAVEYHTSFHGHDRDRMRAAFFNSAEAVAQAYFPIPQGEWCLWRTGKPRVVVSGNCMGINIARAVAAIADVSVYGFDVLNFPDREDELIPFLDEADFILFPVLGADFPRLNVDAMRSRYGSKAVFYRLPFFEGIHPDVTYLGQRGARLRSPLSEYHSRVVLRALADGVSARECVEQYPQRLAALDPRAVFARSEAEFRRREADADLRIADWFFRTIRKQPLMYTVNHPTSDVFLEFARRAMAHFGIRVADANPALVQNTLSGNTVWPVYREVARTLRLRYGTEPVYYSDNVAMGLPELVWRSYEIYERSGIEHVLDLARERGAI